MLILRTGSIQGCGNAKVVKTLVAMATVLSSERVCDSEIPPGLGSGSGCLSLAGLGLSAVWSGFSGLPASVSHERHRHLAHVRSLHPEFWDCWSACGLVACLVSPFLSPTWVEMEVFMVLAHSRWVTGPGPVCFLWGVCVCVGGSLG